MASKYHFVLYISSQTNFSDPDEEVITSGAASSWIVLQPHGEVVLPVELSLQSSRELLVALKI